MSKYYKNQKATFICNGQTIENGIISSVTNLNPLFEEPSYDLVVRCDHIYKQIKESDIFEIFE